MKNKEFVNHKAVEEIRRYLDFYEKGEILNLRIKIDNCELNLKPLGAIDDKQ